MAFITIFFVIIFIGGISAALIVDGAWAFYLYQMIYFMNPGDRWWGSQIPALAYSFLAAATLCFSLYWRRKATSPAPKLIDQPISKWVIGILFMYLFMFIFAVDSASHKQSTIEFAKLAIVIGVAYKLIITEKKLRFALWAYIIGATYVGYVAFGIGRSRGLRLEGIGTVDAPDSNGLAAAIAPAVALLVYYAWLGNKYIKAVSAVCAVLIINAIVLLNSRGAFLGIVVGASLFVFSMLLSRHQRPKQRFMAVLIVVVGTSGAISLGDSYFWERMSTIQEYDDGEKSGSHRVEFWLATFDMMEDYPMGLGVRGYNRVSRYYLDPVKYGNKNKSVHSSWFQSLYELGWPGPILFIGMLLCCYRVSKRAKNYLAENEKIEEYFLLIAIESSILIFIVSGTFINRFRAEILYWLILFLACAVNVFYLSRTNSSSAVKLQNDT
ncbi:MAG: O-antigen ligase family protein [Pseudomonadales bacterium]